MMTPTSLFGQRRPVVFVQDFAVVEQAYDTVTARFTADTAERFRRALIAAHSESDRLQAMVGPLHALALLADTVEVKLGPSRPYQGGLLVSFTWRSHDPVATWLTFDADLQILPVGPICTELVLRGRFYPPTAGDSEPDSRPVVHGVARATIRSFLTELVAGLAGAGA